MRLPGVGNLLSMAQRLVGPETTVTHSAYTGATKNDAGIYSPEYAQAVPIRANVQPVPRTMYEKLGLNFQNEYVTVYTSATLKDLKRDKSPDLIEWGGQKYNVESNTPWKLQNGWGGSICCAVGAAPL